MRPMMIKDASNAIYLAEGPTVGQPQSWRDTTNWWYSTVVSWYNFGIMTSMVVNIICRCQISWASLYEWLFNLHCHCKRISKASLFICFDQRNALKNVSLHKCHRLLCLYLAICLGTRGGRWTRLWITVLYRLHRSLLQVAALCRIDCHSTTNIQKWVQKLPEIPTPGRIPS